MEGRPYRADHDRDRLQLGLLTDDLSPAATEQNFDKAFKPLIDDAGPLAGKTFRYFHEDNVEIEGIYRWTPKLMDDFGSAVTIRGLTWRQWPARSSTISRPRTAF